MSHKANYWLASLDPKRVKSGAFRVLFHLCDHHNEKSDPQTCCYPSQETLRAKTGLSNGALNTSLAEMELDGLLLRRRSTVPGSSERRTYYILGCDFDLLPGLTPETGVSPNSGAPETAEKQTPVLGQANSSLGPSKLRCTGEEPLRTCKNQEEDDAVCASDILFSRLSEIVDANLTTTTGRATVAHWLQAFTLTEAQIIDCVTETLAAAPHPVSSLNYCTPALRALQEHMENIPMQPTGKVPRSKHKPRRASSSPVIGQAPLQVGDKTKLTPDQLALLESTTLPRARHWVASVPSLAENGRRTLAFWGEGVAP